MSRIAYAALVAIAVVGAVALSACGTATQASPKPTPSLVHSGPVGGMPIRPHLEMVGNGRALASGWLRHIDSEGGFWALIAEPPNVMTSAQTIIAVLLPGKITTTDIAQHNGAYLIAEGTVSTDASIRNSGPEIIVDTIKVLGMGQ
jgi:hypothetical protein